MQKILSFNGKWRDYQERVLSELSLHLLDKKLHIVAAPGAGKTTLGIEVMARIGVCALVLAPTLTIRNQWISRIKEAFLTVPADGVLSSDIRNPLKITVITYQALLAAFCKTSQAAETEPEQEDEQEYEEEKTKDKKLFGRFNKDEADAIIAGLKKAGVNLLCFDEAHHLRNEWWKALDYLSENLKTGHILALTATPPYDVSYQEWKRYEKLCGPIDALISIPELVKNGDLCPHQDFIYFSKLRYDESQKTENFINAANRFLQDLEDNKNFTLKLSQARFFTDAQNCMDEIFDDTDFFVSCASFMKSAGIKTGESLSLGEKLRMVILADYICAQSLNGEIKSLGVIPIFETLKNIASIKLGVLTGKIVIIPKSAENAFWELICKYGFSRQDVVLKYDEALPGYAVINPCANIKSALVSLMTELFNAGNISVLTGTQALLGEGWDAPSINSLILSSTVSAYMLSNQMRGRAIRKDKNDADKTANIWHLVTVKERKPYEELKALMPGSSTDAELEAQGNYFHDIIKVSRRFECFECPTVKPPYLIQSGVKRLGLNFSKIVNMRLADRANAETLLLASNRTLTKEAWNKALNDGYNTGRLRSGLEIKDDKKHKDTLIFNATLKYTAFFYFLCFVVVSYGLNRIDYRLIILLLIFIARPVIRYFRTGSIEGCLKQTARCVIETLYASDEIKTKLQIIGISAEKCYDGTYFFEITNVTPEENNKILQAVREILDPIMNPRYIVERRGVLFEFWHTKDYHAVPEIIGKKQKSAELFFTLWKRYISPGRLIYTRTAEGRKLLLKARKKAFSNLFRKDKIHKLSKWG
jgi:superfamily II DNA or RNA helicase